MKISGTYLVKKWDEKPYALIEGRMKATRASVEYAFSGDLEGTANVDYLMYYNSFDAKDPHVANAQYVGLFRVIGQLRGKSGSFALIDNGKFESGTARSTLTIISGSGTAELSNIRGNGSYRADNSRCEYEMDVTL